MTDPETHAQVRGDRNCPTCRGTGVRDCSGSILYDNDGRVRSSSSATTPCYCAKATPALAAEVLALRARERETGPADDDAARLVEQLRRAPGWPALAKAAADTIEAQAATIAALRAERDRLRAELARKDAALSEILLNMGAMATGKAGLIGFTQRIARDALTQTHQTKGT